MGDWERLFLWLIIGLLWLKVFFPRWMRWTDKAYAPWLDKR